MEIGDEVECIFMFFATRALVRRSVRSESNRDVRSNHAQVIYALLISRSSVPTNSEYNRATGLWCQPKHIFESKSSASVEIYPMTARNEEKNTRKRLFLVTLDRQRSVCCSHSQAEQTHDSVGKFTFSSEAVFR